MMMKKKKDPAAKDRLTTSTIHRTGPLVWYNSC
jgi:hypothetical protein